jgi:hypothetical protein
LGMSRIFSGWIWKRFKWHKIQYIHGHGMIDHLGLIHFSYAWLCNWKYPFSIWPEGESPRALHASQALPWKVALTQCGTMQFLCTPITQLVDQPCTTFSSVVGFEIHHQKPQPAGFSHIGWSELLPTNYKVRKTSLVSYKHNRKTKWCLAHFSFLPKSTRLLGRWTKLDVSSCFNHLGWTKPKRKRKGYGVPN